MGWLWKSYSRSPGIFVGCGFNFHILAKKVWKLDSYVSTFFFYIWCQRVAICEINTFEYGRGKFRWESISTPFKLRVHRISGIRLQYSGIFWTPQKYADKMSGIMYLHNIVLWKEQHVNSQEEKAHIVFFLSIGGKNSKVAKTFISLVLHFVQNLVLSWYLVLKEHVNPQKEKAHNVFFPTICVKYKIDTKTFIFIVFHFLQTVVLKFHDIWC